MTKSLSCKLIVSVVASLAAIFTALGYRITQLHQYNLEETTFAAADRISHTIRSSILYSMQRNQREHIYHTIKTIGTETGINRIRIFNEVGKISFSSDDSEIDQFVDKSAEACDACHSAERPLARLERTDRTRIYLGANGDRVLGLITPIENRAPCYESGCHVHSPQQRVLGVLDVNLSLAYVDSTIAKGRNRMIFYLVVSVCLVSLALGFLVWILVHRPIKYLMTGTERLAAGELGYRIPVTTRDEMGALGASFNLMSEELAEAQKELKNWAENLEQRVREKTVELEKAHQKMLQTERLASMGKLAAIVAHEINNPLMGILALTRLLLKRFEKEEGASTEENLDHLRLIASESARCGEIVKGLLQFSQPQKEVRSATDINAVIRESIRLVRHKIDLMGVDARFELSSELGPVICDPQGMRQVFVAVLINACEAMSHGGGLLSVSSWLDSNANECVVSIEDNGCGMDEDTQEKVFEPFFTTKEAVRGVGLGLAVAKGIVSAHGGELKIHSSPGVGTTVEVRLPLGARSGHATVVAAGMAEG